MTTDNTAILQAALSGYLVPAGKVSTGVVPAGADPAAFLQALLQQFQSVVPSLPEGVAAMDQFTESTADGNSTNASGKFLPDSDALMDQLEKQGLTPEQLAQFLAQFVPQQPQPEVNTAPVLPDTDPLPVSVELVGASAIPPPVLEDSDVSDSPAIPGMVAAVAAGLDRPIAGMVAAVAAGLDRPLAAVVKPAAVVDPAHPKGSRPELTSELLSGTSVDAAESGADSPEFSGLLEKAGVGAAPTLSDADKTLPYLKSVPEIAAMQRQPIAAPVKESASPMDMDRPVGRPGWSQDLGERIIWMAGQGLQTAELRLAPRHLGPLEVRIDLNQDQASVQFVSHHASVREAIESAIPKLREMLGAQQLNLMEVNVSQQSFAEQRDNKNAQFAFDQQSRPGRQGFTGQVSEGAAAYPESEPASRQTGRSLLSLYA
jgi:flagellar hook-length control protein FliK